LSAAEDLAVSTAVVAVEAEASFKLALTYQLPPTQLLLVLEVLRGLLETERRVLILYLQALLRQLVAGTVEH
jgi:regulator of sirC expression with transglutaminase-like and TPR domain